MIAATRRLVITADDFGLDLAVNEAVERGHREGVLTAASLMVTGPAAADAVARARRLPGLRVGLHLDLVDGAPALPAASLPHLVKGGGFRGGMVAAGARMFFLAAARRELAAEIAAQVSAFAATGLACDHLNAHKHFHLHPTIARLYLAHATRLGVRTVRVPFEPAAPLKAIESGGQIAVTPLFDALSRRLCDRVHRAGLAAPDQVFGLRWTGAMTASRLSGLIAALPPGVSEIYLHPAVNGGFQGSAPGYRYAEELAALTSDAVKAAVRASGVATGGYADFVA